jgi:hypothetical protein
MLPVTSEVVMNVMDSFFDNLVQVVPVSVQHRGDQS